MNKIDWKQKLSSRKFWALLAGVVVSIVLMIQGDPAITVSGVVMGVGSVVAYILGESWVDAANAKSNTTNTTTNISASTNAKEVVENAISKNNETI